MKNIKVGEIYAWDIKNMLTTCNIGTYTVKVVEVHERKRVPSMFSVDYDDGSPINPLADCISMETGEEFDCDIEWLTDIQTCTRIYESCKKEIDNNPSTSLDNEIISERMTRLDKVFDSINSQNNTVTEVINFKLDITKEDIKSLDDMIKFCVDNNKIEYCAKFSKLKKKLELHLAEQ